MLIAYTAAGDVVGTLAHQVIYDEDGRPLGLIDFGAHEAAGGEVTDFWVVNSGDPANPVKGAKVWPEWLGAAAHSFHVELDGPAGQKRIAALVHKTSGHRRERADVEAAIAAVEPDEHGRRDIRAIVGGPMRPLDLDDNGRQRPRVVRTPPNLPLIRAR